ncbi:hypothetical protein CC86DRAFT_380825 [Ophiobolus disseminans]|uniref:Uncharacterized protein n=1 Tax=Ophiobolus disseminans TaxID=1469910 RepID=A0A6A7A3C6_9PLEO|nr:hypothetical protein CC86DRAFT_380825 [Ophiobolus disseminans]
MVSKQNKNLRREAIQRAEKYEEEQQKKLADNIAAKAAHDGSSSDHAATSKMMINPATGRKLRVDMATDLSTFGPAKHNFVAGPNQDPSIFDMLAARCNTEPEANGLLPLGKTNVEGACEEGLQTEQVQEEHVNEAPLTILNRIFASAEPAALTVLVKHSHTSSSEKERPAQLTTIPMHSASYDLPSYPINLGRPGDAIFIDLSSWAKEETARLQQLQMKQTTCQKRRLLEASMSKDMELMLYRQFVPIISKSEPIPVIPRPTASSPVATWKSERIFFVDVDGNTRLVDLNQTLYNLDVEMDDGASDFDSIASPMKIAQWLAPNSAATDTTSSDESTEEVDSDELAEFEQFNCEFITREAAQVDGETTPATTLNLSDDEDIIDPCLVSTSAHGVETVYLSDGISSGTAASTTRSSETQVLEAIPNLDDDVVPMTTTDYRQFVDLEDQESLLMNNNVDTQHDIISELDAESIAEFHSRRDECELALEADVEVTPVDTTLFTMVDTVYAPAQIISYKTVVSAIELKEDDAINKTTGSAKSRQIFSSDWASELMRTTLGTKSLFTFLEHLEPSDDGRTSKSAIVTTFLQLVSIERKELGERALPSSYTTSSVLASKIVPHTTFLGITSLATLLAQFGFGMHGETTVDEVYRVFKAESKEDLCLQVKASTGVIGALGFRLGKLPKFEMV